MTNLILGLALGIMWAVCGVIYVAMGVMTSGV